MPAKTTPRILHSPLTGNYYIATRYTQHPTHIEAHTKYDCTDQMMAILANMVSLEDVEAALDRALWIQTLLSIDERQSIKEAVMDRLKGKEGS